ncbi:MAG: hypothetical protein JNN16_11015, partial [Nitrospira sp.]|nr:hypothetical protein [Nitrospira sp.]
MSSGLRTWLAKSDVFSYNVVLRDRWIARQASKLQPGTRLLDVGAGSCPYRNLFAHCEYRSQDLRPLQGEQLRFGGYGQIDYVSDLASIPVPENSFDAV